MKRQRAHAAVRSPPQFVNLGKPVFVDRIKSPDFKSVVFLKAVFFPFFVAMIISYVLNPVVTLLSSRMVPDRWPFS